MANQTEADFQRRIDSMFHWDGVFSWVFVISLWVTYVFTYWAVMYVSTIAARGDHQLVLIIGGALVLVYNTASIWAMGKHYAGDKEFIYSVDLRHLDRLKEERKNKT